MASEQAGGFSHFAVGDRLSSWSVVGADADLSHFRGVRRSFGEPAGRFRKRRRFWGLSRNGWLTRTPARWLNLGPAPTIR